MKKEEPESKIEKLQSKVNGDESASCEVTPVNKVVDEAVSTILSLQVPDLPSSKSDNKTPQVNSNSKDIPLEEKNVKIEQIKQGWTVENCGSLTVGEIYLMVNNLKKKNCNVLYSGLFSLVLIQKCFLNIVGTTPNRNLNKMELTSSKKII